MKREFTIPVKTFSVNAMYGQKKYKTQDAREWSYTVLHCLSEESITLKLKELREHFDPSKHCYKIQLTAYYPKNILFTKKGQLSSRAHDISNWEKPLIDLIFLPDHFDKKPPYGCENLNIDDKYLVSLSSEKRVSEDDTHKIKISLTCESLHL